MPKLEIVRTGGFAGLVARGELDLEILSAGDRAAVDALFKSKGRRLQTRGADRYIFKLRRVTAAGVEEVELPEGKIPPVILGAVRDELPR